MPPTLVRTLGRSHVRMVRVSEMLVDCDDEVRWCERVRDGFTAARVYAEVVRVPGIVAVYRERAAASRLPMFSRHGERHVAPKVARIRARVQKIDGKWGAATVYALAREYRCAFCRRVFLLDEHGQEYRRDGGGGEIEGVDYTHLGTNGHSRCCRDCLPGLRARLPVCDEDAERDRALDALRKQEEAG
jgi:hypothetical protein